MIAYRCYVTDLLRVLAESRFVGAKVDRRYAEIIDREVKPQKTAKQVIRSMRAEFAKLRRKDGD